MACPVCDHTMQWIAGADRVFWCPRCGTLKDCGQRASAGLPDEIEEGGDDRGVYQPKIVGRAFRVHQSALDFADEVMTKAPGMVNSMQLRAYIRDSEECIGNPS